VCGIAGVLSWESPPDLQALVRMTRRLAHRGPDAEGFAVRGPLALGHRRLAVIDVGAESNQPLSDTSGQYWICLNGEIYNYRELRDELAGLGASFKTRGDSEVVIEAYKRWGIDCLERLNGMFAFGLWDERQRRLVLARDRAGEKPLYYQPLSDGGVAFASELTALREHPLVSRKVSPRALSHYLSLNYTLSNACILEGVRKLEAAHALVFERGLPGRSLRYWDLAACYRDKARFRSEAEAAEALRALIDDAVRLRLVADVPLGAFLSGGVDSSAIVAAISHVGPPGGPETFSAGFEEDSYSELAEARFVARHFETRHHELTVAPAPHRLHEMLSHCDEPFADSSAIPVFFLAEFTRRHVTVSLSGDGADELFAGYETYVADRLRGWVDWVPRPGLQLAGWLARSAAPPSRDKLPWEEKLRRLGTGLAHGPRRAHALWREIFSPAEKRTLLRPELGRELADADPIADSAHHFSEVEGCDFVDQATYFDVKTWLVDDILVKLDRQTMAHALEARTPFLDHRVMEFAARLPADWKLRGLRRKHLLLRSQATRLPAQVLRRAKRGFNAPVSHWLAGALEPTFRDIVAGEGMREWFEPTALLWLLEEHRAQRADHGLKLYGLLALGLWLERLDGRQPEAEEEQRIAAALETATVGQAG